MSLPFQNPLAATLPPQAREKVKKKERSEKKEEERD
jgi:hypothetical protein